MLLEWLGFYTLHYKFDVNYISASIMMFVFISTLGFIVYKKIIFGDSKLKIHQEIFAIYAINIIGICLNILILWLCVEFLSIGAMLGKIISSFLVVFYSFFARKILVYKG